MEQAGLQTRKPGKEGVFQEILKCVSQMPTALPTHGADRAKGTAFTGIFHYVSPSSAPLLAYSSFASFL